MGDEEPKAKLYVPPTAGQAHDEETATDDPAQYEDHGYQLPGDEPKQPREGEDVKEKPKFRTAFIVFLDHEGMALFSTDPNDILDCEIDRPALPNDLSLACAQIVRDMDLQATAQATAMQVMMSLQATAQATARASAAISVQQQTAAAEIARIDAAARRGK